MKQLQRKNIQQVQPYTAARDLYKTGVFLDANENYRQLLEIDWTQVTDLNRYPDSTSDELRSKLVSRYVPGFSKENIFVGSGSDEIIDLLIRGFVEDTEEIVMMNPSYSVYEVQAAINNVRVKKILLNPDYSLPADAFIAAGSQPGAKLMFLCHPNNPSGNLLDREAVEKIVAGFSGLVIIDEAYIEFAGLENSLVDLVSKYQNVVVLRTFSKAWGLAGIRVGYCVARPETVEVLLKIKDSYNVSKPSQLIAMQALDQVDTLWKAVEELNAEKQRVVTAIRAFIPEVKDTAANFVLVPVPNAKAVQKKIAEKGIIVRDRSSMPLMENMLRLTIGARKENDAFLEVLKETYENA